jgi:hypothetical protein
MARGFVEMRLDEVRKLLQNECSKAGGVAAWAQENGFSRQYVSFVLKGQRPSPKLAEALGLREDGYRWAKK